MSLINQALKKAQRDRESQAATPNPSAPSPAPMGSHAPRPGNPASATSFKLTVAAVGVALAIGGTVAAYFLLSDIINPEPVEVVQPELPSEVAVKIKLSTPPPSPQPESTALGQAPESQINFALPVEHPASPPASPTAQPAPSTPQQPVAQTPPAQPVTPPPAATPPAPPVTTQPVATAPAEPTPPAAPTTSQQPISQQPVDITFSLPAQPVTVEGEQAPAPTDPLPTPVEGAQPDAQVVAFLEQSRITGIKVAGSESRVLMNNQIFKAGQLVDPTTQLRIKTIRENEIEFIDGAGLEYRKQFQR